MSPSSYHIFQTLLFTFYLLLIPEFWISLISKGRTPVLIGTHQQGLYHANVILESSVEVAHATVDINLLH
ncbi:hypothetical protein PAXRUDRAFT_17887 [Paxillus rubicundulus Ve08.2h10]|uniref:Uncharacterized protein n=1 Tax=Paxillus rubicundulus Ve08.2h10 TaxID=930991 RepID=A0A0D0D021_9AGAM|nr:hypothetical protein PAXRUDRAFT_17887 [Paxillus rubicundulus Ve08.2h10]